MSSSIFIVEGQGRVLPFKSKISKIWNNEVIGSKSIIISAKLTAGGISTTVASKIQITP